MAGNSLYHMGRVIDWRMDWLEIKDAHKRGDCKMQRQFTIEIRVNYADAGKNVAMQKTVQACARMMLATATLLCDQGKPDIVMFTDDFFDGQKEIALMDDTIGQGEEQLVALGNAPEDAVDQELLDAFKDNGSK